MNTEPDNQQKLEYEDSGSLRRYLIAFAFFFAIVPVVGILHYILDWPWLEAIAAVVPQGVFATGILMSKRTVVIDIAEQTVTESYTLWFVWLHWHRAFYFSDFSRVLLSVWHFRYSTNFYVYLVTNERKKVSVSWQPVRHKARDTAETLARAMGLGIEDESLRDADGKVSIEDREEVQKPQVERSVQAARSSDLPIRPVMPGGSRVSCCIEGNGVRIQIRAKGIRVWHIPVFIVWLCTPLALWLPIILSDGPHRTSVTILYLVAVLGSVFVLALVYGVCVRPILQSATRSFDILVSPDQLAIHETIYRGGRAFTSSLGELQELRMVVAMHVGSFAFGDLTSPTALLARSKSESITFGQGLSNEELNWLKAVIERVLAAGVGGRDQMVDDGTELTGKDAEPS